jgi:hypothetical protein
MGFKGGFEVFNFGMEYLNVYTAHALLVSRVAIAWG